MSHSVKNSYPIQYIKPISIKDGTIVQLRPIHKDDGEKYWEISECLSDETLHNRFLGFVKITDKLIQRFTELDYSREMAIVAELIHGNERQIIGIARIATDVYNTAEFAITIIDDYQGRGLGKQMTDYILQIAKELGYKKINARVFSSNEAMLNILKKVGFEMRSEDNDVMFARLDFEDEYHCHTLNW